MRVLLLLLPAPVGRLPGDPVETPELREAACCRSEPPCLLCPLQPENAGRSLRELRDEGLYANLERLGFRAHR